MDDPEFLLKQGIRQSIRIGQLATQLSDCEAVVRQYRRISSTAGDKAWRVYQAKYTESNDEASK